MAAQICGGAGPEGQRKSYSACALLAVARPTKAPTAPTAKRTRPMIRRTSFNRFPRCEDLSTYFVSCGWPRHAVGPSEPDLVGGYRTLGDRCGFEECFYRAMHIYGACVGGMGEALKIGITGLPGAGKTYCLLKVIEMLEGDGLKVGGMITEPIIKRNRREGFYVMDWGTKEKRVFASREIQSKTMVGRYGVDISALEEVGVNALRSATANADVIVIDEIGRAS